MTLCLVTRKRQRTGRCANGKAYPTRSDTLYPMSKTAHTRRHAYGIFASALVELPADWLKSKTWLPHTTTRSNFLIDIVN